MSEPSPNASLSWAEQETDPPASYGGEDERNEEGHLDAVNALNPTVDGLIVVLKGNRGGPLPRGLLMRLRLRHRGEGCGHKRIPGRLYGHFLHMRTHYLDFETGDVFLDERDVFRYALRKLPLALKYANAKKRPVSILTYLSENGEGKVSRQIMAQAQTTLASRNTVDPPAEFVDVLKCIVPSNKARLEMRPGDTREMLHKRLLALWALRTNGEGVHLTYPFVIDVDLATEEELRDAQSASKHARALLELEKTRDALEAKCAGVWEEAVKILAAMEAALNPPAQ